MRLGLIARMDKTGLANQTRNLAEMLRPQKVLVIDSTPFGKGKQYPAIYRGYNAYKGVGMLRPSEGMQFMRGIDTILSCEMFYSTTLINDAKRMRVKTVLQYNYEFLINLLPGNHPLPDIMLAPSEWRIEEAKEKFPNVHYLPPPTNADTFESARNVNLNNHGKKFLHIVGNKAAHDRNGTDDVIEALRYTKSDFELHIKSQLPLLEYTGLDPRIKIDYSNPLNENDLYSGYDALILPRRYAGLCLPMNEGLMSGLPVIMTDIDPNNRILPPEWLVEAKKRDSFMTKTMVDVYESDLEALAEKIDWLCSTDISAEKQKAYKLGHDNFSFEVLRPKYEEILA